MPVEMSQGHGRHLSVLVVVLELQLEHVLLDLRVSEWLQDSPAVRPKEVVAHVRVEVEEVKVVDEVPLLGGILELLVIVVDDAHPVRLTVSQVARQVASHPGPEQWWDPSRWGQMVLVDVVQDSIVQRYEVLDFRF